jgi:hypothetical protein
MKVAKRNEAKEKMGTNRWAILTVPLSLRRARDSASWQSVAVGFARGRDFEGRMEKI